MYNYNYPNYLQTPAQAPMQTPAQIQQPQSSIIWVQGISAAKSYLVAPAQSVLLMDSEESRFYIKSTDVSGMPMPLRMFEYHEISEAPKTASGAISSGESYVTREELKALEMRLKSELSGLKGESANE